MSNVYGVTPQGFVPKPLSQIIQDFSDAEVATIDPALDTSPVNPLGQLNGIYGDALAEAWELAQIAYDGFDRDNSEGAALDAIGALTGTLRLAPKPSAVYCTINATPGTYAAGALTAVVGGGPALPFGALAASVGQLFVNAQEITVPSLPLNSLGVTGLDNVLFISVEDGPIICPSGWLITISVPLSGWTAITNAPNDAIPGNLLESDTAYRLRQESELSADGACTVDALTAALLAIPGVNAANVIDNPSGTPLLTVSPPLPPHSFEAVVLLGPTASLGAVAQTIWNNKPAGIQAFGNGSQAPVIVLDSQGNPQQVSFSVVTERQVYIAFVVSFDPTLSALDKYNVGFELAQTAAQLSQGLSFAGAPIDPATPGVLAPGGPVIASGYEDLCLTIGGITDRQVMAMTTGALGAFPFTGQTGTIPGAAGPSPSSLRTDGSQIGATQIGMVSLEDGASNPSILVYEAAAGAPILRYSATMPPP
jgi:hypothetical protein